jgi:Ca-activated chloride channel family protein
MPIRKVILKTKLLPLNTFFLLSLSFFVKTSAQTKTRLLFIFDDSYSMYAGWNSPTPKIEIAKKVMGDFLDSLKKFDDLEIALRCYGHTTFFKEKNCKDSKLEVPFADVKTNYLRVKQRIQKLEPTGTTPIAYSLGHCTADFPSGGNYWNVVILITDSIEEFDGNPWQLSMDL